MAPTKGNPTKGNFRLFLQSMSSIGGDWDSSSHNDSATGGDLLSSSSSSGVTAQMQSIVIDSDDNINGNATPPQRRKQQQQQQQKNRFQEPNPAFKSFRTSAVTTLMAVATAGWKKKKKNQQQRNQQPKYYGELSSEDTITGDDDHNKDDENVKNNNNQNQTDAKHDNGVRTDADAGAAVQEEDSRRGLAAHTATLNETVEGSHQQHQYDDHQRQQQQQQPAGIHMKRKSRKEARRESEMEIHNSLNQAGYRHLRRQPKNIYQQPLGIESLADFKPPSFSRTKAERKFIYRALNDNFVFSDLTHRDVEPLVQAFERCAFEAGEVIIDQGDPGDYFYIILKGSVEFHVNGVVAGTAGMGGSFGELALLYVCPRACTVVATGRDGGGGGSSEASGDEQQQQQLSSKTELLRVDQKTFRCLLQKQTHLGEQEKIALLQKVPFLEFITDEDKKRLTSVMVPVVFEKDQELVHKGDLGNAFYIIQEGRCLIKDIQVGSTVYEDQEVGPGEYFGERALVTSEPRAANIIGLSHGIAFAIDRTTFERVLGRMSRLILKAQDVRRLSGIKALKRAQLTQGQLTALASLIEDQTFPNDAVIMEEGGYDDNQVNGRGGAGRTEAALYFVREGQVRISSEMGDVEKIVDAGGYFGQDLLIKACAQETPFLRHVPYSAKAVKASTLNDDDVVTCGVLTLSGCREVFDTSVLAPAIARRNSVELRRRLSIQPFLREELNEADMSKPSNGIQNEDGHGEVIDVPLKQLQKHEMLGEGTFGQVWLVSVPGEKGTQQKPYALKIQSKCELVEEGQAKAVCREKHVMELFSHPFIIRLVAAEQDDNFIYMLTDYAQGGELFSLLHAPTNEGCGLPNEEHVKFYALCIADALAYMHRGRYCYRDLKPENCMLDEIGYVRLIDMGFCKMVVDKTYTLCGTPGYLAPEVVMTRGHNYSADFWSLGILIYELVTGENPFYYEGMDQMSLFESIVKDDYEPPMDASREATDIISKLLIKDPGCRLGSLARGHADIFEHLWFRSSPNLDLGKMRARQIKAPWVPKIDNAFDAQNFDDWSHIEDKTLQRFAPLDEKDAKIFLDL